MPGAHIDTIGYPILVKGRSEVRRVSMTDLLGSSLSIADGGTVTLYDVAGTSRGSGTTSSGACTYTVSSDCPDGPAREIWSVTAGGTAYIFPVGVMVGKVDLPCPVTDDALKQRIAALGVYPSGETSWVKWRNRGWERVLRDVAARHGSLSLWDPGTIYDAAVAACMSAVLETAAAYGSQPWTDLATQWEHRYQVEIDRIAMRLDTDSDQAPETGPLFQSAGLPSAGGRVS